jgi:hypothetical protein
MTNIAPKLTESQPEGMNSDSDSEDDLSYYQNDLTVVDSDNKYTVAGANTVDRDLSVGTVSTALSSNLSQDPHLFCDLSSYIFLNPRWLMDAVSCILRHDLSNKISETRRETLQDSCGTSRPILEWHRSDSFRNAEFNCPLITSEDACMLWDARKHTKKAVDRIKENSINEKEEPYAFLQRLLTRFRVFVPIDLTIEKTQLGGTIYSLVDNDISSGTKEVSVKPDCKMARFFFLPSLLGPEEPGDHIWTYRTSNSDAWMRTTDSWKTCLCHSILFYDSVPPGLMERITAAVLNEIFNLAGKDLSSRNDDCECTSVVEINLKEILCWRSSFCLTLALRSKEAKGESMVEIFGLLTDRDSSRCVASDSMAVGNRRFITSARGESGASGRKIWCGGYKVVLRTIALVMQSEYGGLAYEHQTICPECLQKLPYRKAGHWNSDKLSSDSKKGADTIRCRHGHSIDCKLVTGNPGHAKKVPALSLAPLQLERSLSTGKINADVPVSDIIQAVVLIGLWDGSKKVRRITNVGSGFIVDRKRGLIVTAAHTLINIGISNDKTDFGKDLFGKTHGRIVIGVIPRSKNQDEVTDTGAVFRYFARIFVKDETMLNEKKYCKVDVCVLQITSKMENDDLHGVDLDGQPEIVLLHKPELMKKEKLLSLAVSTHPCELEENIKILGYEQGGGGIMPPGARINRFCAFAKGYICQLPYLHDDEVRKMTFKPSSEIVAICPTIQGQSGGPCVNLQGEVIGILSRTDNNEAQRCYISPASEWINLIQKAKTRS